MLGAIFLGLLVGCAPEPVVGGTPGSTSGASMTPSPSTPTPRTTATSTASATPSASVIPLPEAGAADVVIITADLQPDGLEVTGIVTGQTDPAGMCLLAVSQGQVMRSIEAPVTTTNGNSYCPLMVVPRNELSAGAWQVVLGYRASGLTGRSAAITVEVS